MGWDRRQTGWVLALSAVGLAFALGWLLGRDADDPAPTSAPSASAPGADGGLRPEDVELRLDAGGLTLIPDGGLTLEPIDALGGDSAAGGSDPTQSP